MVGKSADQATANQIASLKPGVMPISVAMKSLGTAKAGVD